MAEKKDTDSKGSKKSESGLTYEDHGDYVLEIDNRGDDEVRRQLPKALKDIPVDKATREQLEYRLEIEKAAAENEGREPVEFAIPPLKEDKGKDAEPETVTVTAKGAEK